MDFEGYVMFPNHYFSGYYDVDDINNVIGIHLYKNNKLLGYIIIGNDGRIYPFASDEKVHIKPGSSNVDVYSLFGYL